METRNSFVFDFDSTLVSIETLDTLIKQNLSGEDDRRKIDEITLRAMNGELDFSASLASRLRLSRAKTEDFAQMAARIEGFLTPGMDDILDFLARRGQKPFIVSGGFTQIVRPVAKLFGIPDEDCFANEYIADGNGCVVGVKEGPLAREGGKSEVLRALREQNRLPGTVVMLGDGMSDYQVYADGLADLFIGCGFHVARPNVRACSPVFVETTADLRQFLESLLNVQAQEGASSREPSSREPGPGGLGHPLIRSGPRSSRSRWCPWGL
ncbi:MAG: HAD-IB family phosphatase [Synergistaceae bacterium]|jgi:D-3-phosphoglycerate dehydrogenase|nr:HAD-IB family phosphatase [Synergistaceae bacterium]